MKKIIFSLILFLITYMASAQSSLMVFQDWTTKDAMQNTFYKNVIKTDASKNIYIAAHVVANYNLESAKLQTSHSRGWREMLIQEPEDSPLAGAPRMEAASPQGRFSAPRTNSGQPDPRFSRGGRPKERTKIQAPNLNSQI